jgi:hypothetical protein
MASSSCFQRPTFLFSFCSDRTYIPTQRRFRSGFKKACSYSKGFRFRKCCATASLCTTRHPSGPTKLEKGQRLATTPLFCGSGDDVAESFRWHFVSEAMQSDKCVFASFLNGRSMSETVEGCWIVISKWKGGQRQICSLGPLLDGHI